MKKKSKEERKWRKAKIENLPFIRQILSFREYLKVNRTLREKTSWEQYCLQKEMEIISYKRRAIILLSKFTIAEEFLPETGIQDREELRQEILRNKAIQQSEFEDFRNWLIGLKTEDFPNYQNDIMEVIEQLNR